MIIKYDKNNKKLKKSVNFDLQDALKIDAKVFINNIDTISDDKLKTKQGDYKNQSITIRVDNDKKKIDLWFSQIILDTIKNDFESFNKHLEDGWNQI